MLIWSIKVESFAYIERNNKILMLKSSIKGRELCSPGVGIKKGETPEQAVARGLQEECSISGTIIKKLNECLMPPSDNLIAYSFHVDIGEQTPILGKNPELSDDEQSLRKICWMSLDEICERDRVFLWALGLFNITNFFDEFTSWGDDISYPNKQ